MSTAIINELRHLQTYGGLPVPFTVKWIDGKPDFRQSDEEKVARCLAHKLCAICGRKLGYMAYYLGGDLCATNHLFNDPAMHELCARMSMRLCPFVNGKKTEYRGNLPTSPLQDITAGRPARMYLMRGYTSAQCIAKINGHHFAIYAGKTLNIVEEF